MIPYSIFKIIAILLILLLKEYRGNVEADLVLEVPDMNQEDFTKYLKNAKRTVVFLQYPFYFMFLSGAITDFRQVSSLLTGDPKCEFVTVESSTIVDGNVTSIEPVLNYYKDGMTKKYDGPLNVGYMLSWLSSEDVCEMRVKDLNNFKSYQKNLPQGHLQSFLLFGENQHDPKLVEKVRSYLNKKELAVPVMYVPDPALTTEILKFLKKDTPAPKLPNLLLDRNLALFPKNALYDGDLNDDKALDKLANEEMVPPIHSTNSYMLPRFLTMKKTIVYMYTKDKNLMRYLSEDWLRNTPRQHSQKLVFLHSKGSELVENKLNSILAIDAEYDECVVRAFVINLETLEFYKFKPLSLEDGRLNETGMNEFIYDLENNRLSHYVKSELPIPEDIDTGPVKTIVGEDFHKRVIESKKDILVLFLSSWCGHCHKAKRLFRDMGRRLKGTDGPTLATFDSYNNEVEDIEIAQFPTIALFQSGNKASPLFYDGEHNLEEISQFLEANCKHNKVSAENMIQKHVSKEPLFEYHSEL